MRIPALLMTIPAILCMVALPACRALPNLDSDSIDPATRQQLDQLARDNPPPSEPVVTHDKEPGDWFHPPAGAGPSNNRVRMVRI